MSKLGNLQISKMAATVNFDHYLEFYGSNIKNYHENGFFDLKNVYVDGSHLCITIILEFTYFFQKLRRPSWIFLILTKWPLNVINYVWPNFS
jgi:hypothetical protein